MTNSMGLTTAQTDPRSIFVRQFRWLLQSEHLKPDFLASVKIDSVQKIIVIHSYEVAFNPGDAIPIDVWVSDMLAGKYPEETLTFTALDGCGQKMYEKVFSGIEIIGDEISFDYSSSQPALRKITIHYGSSMKSYQWKIRINDKEAPLKNMGRPNLNVEEVEFRFLNSTMWLPGKANWENLKFEILNEDLAIFGPHLAQDLSKFDFELFSGMAGKWFENWGISGATLLSTKYLDYTVELTVSYDSVSYKSLA